MSDPSVLVVYNTCGISGKDNSNAYLESIGSIYDQDYDAMRVVVSACLNRQEHIQKLADQFNELEIFDIQDKLTVNQTFNATVNRAVEFWGEYDAYLYVDSGVTFTDNQTISKMVDWFATDLYGMITAPVDVDHAFHVFGFEYPPNPFIIPVGQACNLHVQMFHDQIRRTFGRIIPDVFASFCTESTFSFLNACIQKKWLIVNNTIAHHAHSMDGASSGFGHGGYTHLLPECPRNIFEIINDPEGTECGFGYEECNRIKMHKADAFTEEGFAKYPDRLIKFIQNNIFLPQDRFDYSKINARWF